jgi:hypothetical protein
MAQHGAGTAREHGRHPPATNGQLAPSDGVDAAVDEVEAAGLEAPLDLVSRVPDTQKLPVGHHAVLPIRQCSDPLIT